MSFTTLKSVADWEVYQQRVTEQLNLAGFQVAWGRGPQDYPCMVTSYSPSQGKVLSAYVYLRDAVEFLNACGVKTTLPPYRPAQDAAPVPAVPAIPTSGSESPPILQHLSRPPRDYMASVAANLLTVAYFLRETGIAKPEAYEQKYNESLALVDEVAAARRDAKKTGPVLHPMDRDIVDRTGPG